MEDNLEREVLLEFESVLDRTNSMEKFKYVCYGVDSSFVGLLRNAQLRAADIVRALKGHFGGDEQEQVRKAITFTYHVLKALGCSLKKDFETAFQPLLIQEYDLKQPEYRAVHCRLLVLEFMDSIKSEEQTTIAEEMAFALDKEQNHFKMGCDLVNGIFNLGLISDPKDIKYMYKLASVYDRQHIFTEYCKQHRIQQPKKLDDEEDKEKWQYKLVNELDTQKQRVLKNRRKKICYGTCLIGMAVLAVIGAVLALITTTHRDFISGSINVTDHSVVSLDSNGFSNTLESVHLKLATDDDTSISMDVFVEDCNKVQTSNNTLPPHSQNELLATYFKRNPYNYLREDSPLYGLRGSLLKFHMSASSTDSTDPGCLRIRIFDNYYLYNGAIDPGETNSSRVDGTIAQSHCLPVGTSGKPPVNSSWAYEFTKAGYIYSTVEGGANVTINGWINGRILNYSLNSLSNVNPNSYCSVLTHDSNECKVSICKKYCDRHSSKPEKCIYLRIQTSQELVNNAQYQVSYTATQAIKYWFFLSSSLTTLSFLALVVLVIVGLVYYCCECCHSSTACKRRSHRMPSKPSCYDRQDSNELLLKNHKNTNSNGLN